LVAQVPVFVKVRLLDTIEDSIDLVQGLAAAGAALVAIHARYAVELEWVHAHSVFQHPCSAEVLVGLPLAFPFFGILYVVLCLHFLRRLAL
jgi:hypothetical protein